LEYVQGTTLRKLAEKEEPSCKRKLRLGEKIATALAAAHREKIVHRDLQGKPDEALPVWRENRRLTEVQLRSEFKETWPFLSKRPEL
jgi:serine/threonine protein kinase